jgi:hypothetical protein
MGFRMHRKDENHDDIAAAYKARGYKVKSTTMVGEGFPDLVIHRDDMPEGYVKIVEVKNGKGKHQHKQDVFAAKGWPVHVVRSVEEIA